MKNFPPLGFEPADLAEFVSHQCFKEHLHLLDHAFKIWDIFRVDDGIIATQEESGWTIFFDQS